MTVGGVDLEERINGTANLLASRPDEDNQP